MQSLDPPLDLTSLPLPSLSDTPYLSLSQGSEAQAMEKLLSTWPSLALHPHSVKPFHWQCGWRTVWSKGQCDLGALAGMVCRMEYHPFLKQALGELG